MEATHAPVEPTRRMADVLGSSHIAGTYSFTGEDVLNEGARTLLEMGSRVIKVMLRENPAAHYPFHSAWPPVANLVEQARTPYFRALFDRPFTTFILMAFAHERPIHFFLDGIGPDEEAAESESLTAFARHLLTEYRGSGKTFVIQNWESDWVLTPPRSGTDPTPTREMDPVRVERMIAWCNARQAGVERARRDVGTDGVMVAHALEVNLVGRVLDGEQRVTNAVLPHTRCDLYSYSAWDTLDDPTRLRDALDCVRAHAPESELYGRDNVYVGEYGAPENCVGGPEAQLRKVRAATEASLEWGARYVVYWQLTCNEPVRPLTTRPSNEDLRGFWLVRPDGTRPPVWDYFRGLLADGR